MTTAEIVRNTQQNARCVVGGGGGEGGDYDGLGSHPRETNPGRGLPHKKDGDTDRTLKYIGVKNYDRR